MGFFQKLFRKKNQIEESPQEMPESNEEELTGILLDKSQIDMTDAEQRLTYVEGCLAQLKEAESQVKQFEQEYETVNAYLKDLEIIEQLPPVGKQLVEDEAKTIDTLVSDHESYKRKKLLLSDETYRQIDALGEETVDAINKMRETENYQELIRSDLQKCEAEKQAYLYRRQEAQIGLVNYKGMTEICIFAVFACIVVLLVLQFGFELDTKIGYILTAAMAAVVLTMLYLKHQEMQRELDVSARGLNKVILLQNRVKIRYVNNTSLLDYLRMKYEVASAAELEKKWDNYIKEKEVRQRMVRTEENLDFHEQELIKLLKKYNLHDPYIWIHQSQALYNPKEMVEVRHSLIARRQKVRRQIEFNTEHANKAQTIIKELVGDYPQYANEILKLVSKWEEKE